MRLDKLLARLPLTWQKGSASIDKRRQITDVVTSPDEASADTVFVCLQTHLKNGHFDANAAYARGCRVFVAERHVTLPQDATALLTESTDAVLGPLAARCHRHPSRHMKVIGVTGTNGKTSTVLLTAALLSSHGYKVGSVTTDGIDLGNRFIHAGATAPSAADLQRTLANMREAGITHAVVEFSAYMLRHGAANGMRFAATYLTDLSKTDFNRRVHRSFEGYHNAKASLFTQKSALSILPEGINDITPRAKRVIRHGSAEYGIRDLKLAERSADGIEFTAIFDGKPFRCRHTVPAAFAVQNAYGALLLSHAVGMPLPAAIKALPTLRVPLRLERIDTSADKRIYLDSAYTGAALERALTALRAITKGRLAVLLGSVGNRARDRRAPLGKAAVTYADFVYFTADDPDTEPIDTIIDDMLSDLPQNALYTIIKDRKAAIRTAVLDTKRGDTLLILSKREKTQLTPSGKLPFDEKALVSSAAEAY